LSRGSLEEPAPDLIRRRDERVLVKSFWQGQEYLYRLVKMLAGGK
jgi:hypothetical protein